MISNGCFLTSAQWRSRSSIRDVISAGRAARSKESWGRCWVSFALGEEVVSNVVSLFVPVLTDEVVAEIESRFADAPLCVQGPQPLSGDGWLLLGFEQGRGPVHDVGIAADHDGYERLWEASGLGGEPPVVDFEDVVVVWFAVGHSSSCPNLRLDDIVIDREARQVWPLVVMPDNPVVCTEDLAGSYQFVAGLERTRLPVGPFEIGLDPQPNGGLFGGIEVNADLSRSGASVSPTEIGESEPLPPRSGTIVETVGSSKYAFDTNYGIGYLGVVNDVHWLSLRRSSPSPGPTPSRTTATSW